MSLHADARTVLARWPAPDEQQERLRARFVRHLDEHPDAMTRSCRPDHLTASTLVLDADLRHVLLTLHAKARRWFQLGGHCEPGDPGLCDAATREAVEESGIDGLVVDPSPVHLDEHAVPFCGGADAGTHHLDVRFAALAPAGAQPVRSEESADLRWWPVDALPAGSDVELGEPLRLAIARLAAPR